MKMNYLNEQKNMQFWQGTIITKLAQNEVFVYGSNPQGINGAGGAKAAMMLSKNFEPAKHGIGRGFNGSNTPNIYYIIKLNFFMVNSRY